MKFSKQTLLKLKKNTKKLKRDAIRGSIKGTVERPRLSVYRSNEHIYAQIIDDTKGETLVSCTTRQRDVKIEVKNGRTCDAAHILGKVLAKRSLEKNIKKVVFDRGPYIYHGRIKAVAEGARSEGLDF
jgi:large subunit ribosomal protein L18